jgi:hypothetical protein
MLIFPPRYYANCVSTTVRVLILHNVESVYFFYINPVYMHIYIKVKQSRYNSGVTQRGFQEFKVSRFHDNGTGWW